MREALTLAQKLAHPFTLATALNFAAGLHYFRREPRATQEKAEALLLLSREHGFPFWEAWGSCLRGWALAEQRHGEGIEQARQGLAILQATGAELIRWFALTPLAEAYGKMGQIDEALATLAQALAVIHKSDYRVFEAELYRVKGDLVLLSKTQSLEARAREAEECFRQAIDIARRQNAKSWGLRAATSLSRLWQRQGRKEEAQQLLAQIYGWFTEGFDTKDLQDAKALLAELS